MRQNGVTIKIRNSLSRLLTAKSRSARGASHQPAFMAWERWEGSEVARWERWESGEVGRHLFVSYVNQGNEGVGWVQDLLAWLQGWKDSP